MRCVWLLIDRFRLLLDREIFSKYSTVEIVSVQILKLGAPKEGASYSDPALFRNSEVVALNFLTPHYLKFLDSDAYAKYLIELENTIGIIYSIGRFSYD